MLNRAMLQRTVSLQHFTVDGLQKRDSADETQIDHDVRLWLANPIFAEAGEEDCRELAIRYPFHSRSEGARFYSMGTLVRHCYVLVRGTVRVFHTLPDDRELTVKLYRAPVIFGDVEIVQGIEALACVEAIDDVTYAKIPAPAYLGFLEKHPRAALAHLKHMAALSYVVAHAERQRYAPVEQRLAILLLSYAAYFSDKNHRASKVHIRCSLSQQKMAKSLAVNRRSIALVIGDWIKAGLISHQRNTYAINDLARMEEIAGPVRQGFCYYMGMELERVDPDRLMQQVAVLSVVDGAQKATHARRTVTDTPTLIGSQPDCDLVIDSDSVASKHARIYRSTTGHRYWVADLGSKKGTFLNGKRITRAVLRDHDHVRLGEVDIVVRIQNATEATLAD